MQTRQMGRGAPGEFTHTGSSANLQRGARLDAAPNTAVTLTGIAAALTYASGPQGYTLSCSAGAFALTGSSANLLRGIRLVCVPGTFVLNGTATGLRVQRRLSASPQQGFTRSGTATALRAGRGLTAASRDGVLAGLPTWLSARRRLAALAGTYSVTGVPASLNYSGAPAAAALRGRLSAYVPLCGALAGFVLLDAGVDSRAVLDAAPAAAATLGGTVLSAPALSALFRASPGT